MTYSPPDPVIVERISTVFLSGELYNCACAMDLVKRERRFDNVALFYTVSPSFAGLYELNSVAFFKIFHNLDNFGHGLDKLKQS